MQCVQVAEGEVTENMENILAGHYVKEATLTKILAPVLLPKLHILRISKRPWKAINQFWNMKKIMEQYLDVNYARIISNNINVPM